MKFPKTKVNSTLYAAKKLKNILKEMDAASKVKELIMNISALLIKGKKQRYSPITVSTLRCSDAIAAMSDTSFRPDHHREQYSIKPINCSVDTPSDQISVSSYLQSIDEDQKCSSREEEIDGLADAFIASFHQRMKLEKQKSYRNYEDMLARST